jgi:hypothetical protein
MTHGGLKNLMSDLRCVVILWHPSKEKDTKWGERLRKF